MSYLLAGSRVTAFTRRLHDLPSDTPYSEILRLDSLVDTMFDDLDWINKGADELDEYPAWVAAGESFFWVSPSLDREAHLLNYM